MRVAVCAEAGISSIGLSPTMLIQGLLPLAGVQVWVSEALVELESLRIVPALPLLEEGVATDLAFVFDRRGIEQSFESETRVVYCPDMELSGSPLKIPSMGRRLRTLIQQARALKDDLLVVTGFAEEPEVGVTQIVADPTPTPWDFYHGLDFDLCWIATADGGPTSDLLQLEAKTLLLGTLSQGLIEGLKDRVTGSNYLFAYPTEGDPLKERILYSSANFGVSLPKEGEYRQFGRIVSKLLSTGLPVFHDGPAGALDLEGTYPLEKYSQVRNRLCRPRVRNLKTDLSAFLRQWSPQGLI